MLPRFSQDYRALFWAFVLFPFVPVLGYARPALAPFLLPLALYFAYASGVLSHNHNHTPVFRNRAMNAAYASWLSIFYGCPLFVWIPTHNQNHHRYLDGEGDATRTSRHSSRNTLGAALAYPFLSGTWQLPAVLRYVRESRLGRPRRFRHILVQLAILGFGHAGLFVLAVALHGFALGAVLYFSIVALPALFAPWSMMFTNYVQHVGCDPASPDNHSRNFVSPLMNWFVFDNGYHTVHHEHPGVHWSRYRELHLARASRIDPRLNPRSILGYCLAEYLVAPLRRTLRRARSETRGSSTA